MFFSGQEEKWSVLVSDPTESFYPPAVIFVARLCFKLRHKLYESKRLTRAEVWGRGCPSLFRSPKSNQTCWVTGMPFWFLLHLHFSFSHNDWRAYFASYKCGVWNIKCCSCLTHTQPIAHISATHTGQNINLRWMKVNYTCCNDKR